MKEIMNLVRVAARSSRVWSTMWLWMAIMAFFGIETASDMMQDALVLNLLVAIGCYVNNHQDYIQDNNNNNKKQ